MTYITPKTEKRELTLNNVTYSVEYYKAPSASTAIDENYPEYIHLNTKTYSVGDWVKIEVLKKKFRCKDNNVSQKHPLEYPELWEDFGPLNSYGMLATDSFLNAVTTGENLEFTFDFSRSTAFALIAIDFIEVEITQYDADNKVIYNKAFSGRKYGVNSFVEYCYLPFKALSRLVVMNLKWLPQSTLKVKFTGKVSIGASVYSVKETNGYTAVPINLKIQDNSKITTSEITGARTVLRRGVTKTIPAILTVSADDFNVSVGKMLDIFGKNILFIPSNKEKLFELITLCYIEDADYEVDSTDDYYIPVNFIGVL